MKLYISMPMKGKSPKQINRDRNIAKAMSALGHPGSASESGCMIEYKCATAYRKQVITA